MSLKDLALKKLKSKTTPYQTAPEPDSICPPQEPPVNLTPDPEPTPARSRKRKGGEGVGLPPRVDPSDPNYGRAAAGLYRFINKKVQVRGRIGTLLSVFADKCEFWPDGEAKTVHVAPEEVKAETIPRGRIQ
jgi:hypothetical protein